MKNPHVLGVVVSGKSKLSEQKWMYLDKDSLPEALDGTNRIVSARSDFLALLVNNTNHNRSLLRMAKPPIVFWFF